ncbi:MAG: hypothetical protein RIT27_1611 [Pseudomonadota bacterium]|jgi:predicted metalloprotease with PDZ domain
MNPIHYQLLLKKPHAHLFEIRCHVTNPDPNGQQFYLPTWTMGSYLIREFARHIVEIRAESSGIPLKLTKINKNTWKTSPIQQPITIIYEVYAKELSVRTAYFDQHRAFFNGANLFLAVKGQESQFCTLNIQSLQSVKNSKIATMLPFFAEKNLYQAQNYLDFLDYPVEISNFIKIDFKSAGIPHQIVISGQPKTDLKKLAHDVQKICETTLNFFGGNTPFHEYLFLVHATNNGYGGLEHQNSCALICNREDLPLLNQPINYDNYQRLLGLFSHEYFHAWHVKKIKPSAFEKPDLNCESYTRQLWIFEGITSYYDDLMLLRSGCISINDYLILVSQNITRVLRSIGRFKQPVTEASFDTWIKAYRPNENTPNATISYYAKGALISLALDLTLRIHTPYSLDKIMKYFWTHYSFEKKGLEEHTFESAIGQLCDIDLKDFFERFVHGTEDPPLENLLSEFGISLQTRTADSQQDTGGKPSKTNKLSSLGMRYKSEGDTLKITHVFNNGSAEQAGLSANDLIVAINGFKATTLRLDNCGLLEPNTVLEIHVFRCDELQKYSLVLQPAPLDTCVLSVEENAPISKIEKRRQWLKVD